MEALIAAGTALIWVIAVIIIVGAIISLIGAAIVGHRMRSMMRDMHGRRTKFGHRSPWP